MTRTHWRALDPSGLAHAFATGETHALCGMRNAPPIHDWPTRLRCALCTVRDAERATAEAIRR